MIFSKFKKKFLRNPLFSLLILAIILVAIFFRTYNYPNRVFIQADNSRDVQVAKYGADNLKIPQIGQFSSAGPFFYGPWYYWFLEIVTFLPLGFFTHWYAITFIYLIFIWLIYWLGNELGGKWLGALAALYTAISPAQINFSFSVWNPAIVPILSLASLIFLTRLFKNGKIYDAFLLGFFISLAITIHFQNILLLPLLFIFLAVIKIKRLHFLKYAFVLILGFLIPLLPLIYFDLNNNWYETKSVFIYLAFDQYKIWVPNRWLFYLRDYWPKTWGSIIGGSYFAGTIIIALLSVFTILKFKDYKKNRRPRPFGRGFLFFAQDSLHLRPEGRSFIAQNKLFFLIALSFILEVFMFRYYRGDRFYYYSLFAHPPVILLTAWVSYQLFKFQKIIGLILIVLMVASTFRLAWSDLEERSVSLKKVNLIKNAIYSKFPQKSFDIYGCKYSAELVSHPLALLMYYDGRENSEGEKIGVCQDVKPDSWSMLTGKETVRDNGFWFNFNTPTVYKTTVEWWKDNPPGKGDFWQFLKSKLRRECFPKC